MKLLLTCVVLFMTFYSSTAQSVTKLWQKNFGGSRIESVAWVLTTADKGFLVAGSSKSNDGDVSGHHGSLDSTDAWVVRTDSAGNKLWARSYGGNGTDAIVSVAHAPGGGFICAGNTTSNDGDVSGNHGDTDIWVVRLDDAGNILWSRCLGGTGSETARRVRFCTDGGFLVGGTTFSNNGDVSGNNGGSDAWAVKLNAAGNIEWKYCFGTAADNSCGDIIQLPDGNFAISRNSREVVNTHPVYGDCISIIGVLIKFNPAGGQILTYTTPVWNSCGSFREDRTMNSFESLPNGNLMLVNGYEASSGTIRKEQLVFDNNTGSVVLRGQFDAPTSNGSPGQVLPLDDYFFLSYFGWGTEIYKCGPGISFPLSQQMTGVYIDGISPNNYITASSSGNFTLERYIDRYNTIRGMTYQDQNRNNIQDNNEPPYMRGWVEVEKPGRGLTRQYIGNGGYLIYTDTGSYVTRFNPSSPFYTASPAQKNTSFGNNFYKTDTINFAITTLPGMRDYAVAAMPRTSSRPGFTTTYEAIVRNNAIDTLVNKPLRMVKDNRLGFISATPAPTSIVGDTLTWNIAQLLPDAKKEFQVLLQVPVIPAVTLADTLKSVFSIDTAGDIFKANNISAINQRVTGSYDPNDKFENHGGTVERQALLNGEELLYTIRFQNTGTDTAFKVVIRDTLDAKLDPATMSMEKASHPYQLQQQYGNIAIWTFDNILLPDSNVNEPASNGYLSFRIRAKNTVADGDTLKNRSAIYFDFNPPIITNMVTTVVGSKLPVPVVANIANLYCNLQGQQTGKLTNPPANTTISVLLDGQPLVYTPADSLFRFDVSSLAEGNHEIKAKYTNNSGSDSAMKPFTVNRFVQAVINTPDQAVCKLSGAINLQANTNVSWSGTGVSGSSFNPATAGVGTHKIIATKTNGNCPDSKDTLTITVDDFVQAVINTPDQTVCRLAAPVSLQANTNVSWAGPGVSGTSFNPLTAGAGTHRIIATKTNGTCPDSKDTLIITVDDFVQALINTPDQTLCKLSGSINLQANTTVSWAGPGISGSSFNPATAGVGVHRIMATKTNGTCPDSKDTLTITVDDFVQAVIGTPDQTVCKLSGAINLQANTNVNWSGPGVSGSTFNPATAGVGIHRIIATKTNGTCPDSKDTLTITVDDFIKPVILNNDTSICQLAPSFVLRSNVSVSWSGPGTGGGSFNPITAGPGTHLVVASKTNGVCPDGKDTLLVTVRAAVTPVVNVTASAATLSTATSFSDITAVNTSGGGTAPLFTFAKDAGFTQVLQAESANSSLRVLPQMLNAGLNTIFVRMRTSSDCYTAATAVASVQLQLDVNTPVRSELDKALKVFPNPNNGRFGFRFETGINDVVRAVVLDMKGKQVFEANYGQVAQYNFGRELVIRRPQGEYVLVLYVGAEKLVRKVILSN